MSGQFPPSMKKKLLEPLSSQEEEKNAKVCHVQYQGQAESATAVLRLVVII